jgi:DNA-binding IclR family transcriptional regulator
VVHHVSYRSSRNPALEGLQREGGAMAGRAAHALRVIRLVADRPDPLTPLPVSAVARSLDASLSTASRLCAELDRAGMLARGGAYGTYALGPDAIRLSGTASAPFAHPLRFALTLAAQQTGETVLLAAPTAPGQLRVIDTVSSAWTLHAPAELGELVTAPDSAVRLAFATTDDAAPPRLEEVTRGSRVEIATVVRSSTDEPLAVLATRLPLNRATRNGPRARRAMSTARRVLEEALHREASHAGPRDADAPPRTAPEEDSTVTAIVRVLRELAHRPDTAAGIARATGLHPDRTSRLLRICEHQGFSAVDPDTGTHRLTLALHAWHRAATIPTIRTAAPLVTSAADGLGISAFITTLTGMRSHTLVEELRTVGDGLAMTSWLGRAHPLIGSDGGPTMLVDFDPGEIEQLLPARHTPQERMRFTNLVRRASRDGVLTMQAYDDPGVIAVSAPIRDSSGTVIAAACLVGPTATIRSRTTDIEDAARRLAHDVSTTLT